MNIVLNFEYIEDTLNVGKIYTNDIGNVKEPKDLPFEYLLHPSMIYRDGCTIRDKKAKVVIEENHTYSYDDFTSVIIPKIVKAGSVLKNINATIGNAGSNKIQIGNVIISYEKRYTKSGNNIEDLEAFVTRIDGVICVFPSYIPFTLNTDPFKNSLLFEEGTSYPYAQFSVRVKYLIKILGYNKAYDMTATANPKLTVGHHTILL